MKRITTFLYDILFPLACIGCGREHEALCAGCQNLLPAQAADLIAPGQPDRLIACDYHSPLVAELIKAFKYHNLQIYGETLGRLLIERVAHIELDRTTVV